LPSGGIVARDDLLKGEPTTVEKFVRATLMGFLFTHDNRAGTIKVLAQSLKVDEQLAAKIYDGSRPTMTADGTLPDEAQKKMIALVSKLSGTKEAPASERPFDFSVIRKAHATLRSNGWQP
jgi:ABC-type nitrate/sulfonate/bicarbonate transport system substrate-binding protein